MFDTERDDSVEAPEVPAEDVIDELTALMARRERLDATISGLIRRSVETEAFRRDGYPSMSALLRHRMSMHPGEAHRLVTRANGLADAPIVTAAFASGALTGAQVDVLLDTKATAPDAFTGVEGALVSAAVDIALIADLRKVMDYWLDETAPDDLAHERHLLHEQQSLRLRREGQMMRISGLLPIETGERLGVMVDPGPPTAADSRAAAARRADRFTDIVLNGASAGPDLIVHVAAETLSRHAGHDTRQAVPALPPISETSYGTFLTADEIQRLACDCTITRVIFGAESQPLDVGRTRRLVTPALRRAVLARDLRCVFPGCDRPPQWCDIHHIIPWTRGGPTAIDNLILLCRHHHTFHAAGWSITGQPPHIRFIRTDGTHLHANPPPSPQRPPAIWDTDSRPTFPRGGLIDLIKQVHDTRGSP